MELKKRQTKTLTDWGKEELKEWVSLWTTKYPFDVLLRKERGIVFGSREHREIRYSDLAFEIQEEILIIKEKIAFLKSRHKQAQYKKTGIWLDPLSESVEKWDQNQGLSQEEFDNIDLSKF